MTPHAKLALVPSAASTPIAAASDSSASGDFDRSGSGSEAEQFARYRLVIEEGPRAGAFIYKTLDRVTGEIVRQLPREQVVEMMQASDYSAGRVIDTSA
jgi:flagellar protein FlaG